MLKYDTYHDVGTNIVEAYHIKPRNWLLKNYSKYISSNRDFANENLGCQEDFN